MEWGSNRNSTRRKKGLYTMVYKPFEILVGAAGFEPATP